MIIDCISDLHGFYPTLEGGDLLIVAGDLTRSDQPNQYMEFREWLQSQDYQNKIVIGGNHDTAVEDGRFSFSSHWLGAEYLCDSGCSLGYRKDPKELTFDILKVWGSPWTPWFHGINPKCKAWTLQGDSKLAKKWAKIPKETDILITHGPPFGFGDLADRIENNGTTFRLENNGTTFRQHVGSESLLKRVLELQNLKLHIFGHIHEDYHDFQYAKPRMINCSHVNRAYQPVNKPIRVIL